MLKARQSKLDNFYQDQTKQLIKSIRNLQSIDHNNPTDTNSNLNLLFLGPEGSSKSLLIRSICKAMSHVHNLNVETIQTQGLILSKTELSKPNTYKLGNVEYRGRRGISLYQFHQKISLNSLNCFSKLFGLIQDASQALCNCKSTQRSSGDLPIQCIILVIDIGTKTQQQEIQCMRHILNDLRQRQIQPILALCSKPEQYECSQSQHLQKIEQQIKNSQELFSIQRECVFALELSQAQFTIQNNYYLLRLFQAALKQASLFSMKNISKIKKSRGWSNLFFPCWS